MSQADSVYQQLRSHLAYLDFGAAAEALPAHLEAARANKMGHTEFFGAPAASGGGSHRAAPLGSEDAFR